MGAVRCLCAEERPPEGRGRRRPPPSPFPRPLIYWRRPPYPGGRLAIRAAAAIVAASPAPEHPMEDRVIPVLLSMQVLMVESIVSMAALVETFQIAVQIDVPATVPKPVAMLSLVEVVDVVVKVAMVAVDRAMEVAMVQVLIAMEVAMVTL